MQYQSVLHLAPAGIRHMKGLSGGSLSHPPNTNLADAVLLKCGGRDGQAASLDRFRVCHKEVMSQYISNWMNTLKRSQCAAKFILLGFSIAAVRLHCQNQSAQIECAKKLNKCVYSSKKTWLAGSQSSRSTARLSSLSTKNHKNKCLLNDSFRYLHLYDLFQLVSLSLVSLPPYAYHLSVNSIRSLQWKIAFSAVCRLPHCDSESIYCSMN